MYTRTLLPILEKRAANYPAVAILGPRQSGKTTLAKATFPNHIYLSLEDRTLRERAIQDPKGFFQLYKDAPGVILDEFQNAPEILSYLQIKIDEQHRPGYFILTGSQNFLMNKAISQTLAGRISILTLLPLSINELSSNSLITGEVEKILFRGCYPRIYLHPLDPTEWYPDYIETYVERDLRDLSQITNLSLFRKFIGLCAGRTGQILNLTSLANDCGVTFITARSWLALLEASYIIFLLQPYHSNFGKRLIKTPKLYFYDTGLTCALLGIKSEIQLNTHYLRGNLFETFIIADIMKQFYNNGHRPRIYFWQDSQKHEVDCIVEHENKLIPIETKASHTITSDFFNGVEYWNSLTGGKPSESYIVYAGEENQPWPKGNVISWQKIPEIISY